MASSSCEFLVKKREFPVKQRRESSFSPTMIMVSYRQILLLRPKMNGTTGQLPRVVVSVVCLALSLAAPLQGSDTLLTHSSGVSAGRPGVRLQNATITFTLVPLPGKQIIDLNFQLLKLIWELIFFERYSRENPTILGGNVIISIFHLARTRRHNY